MIMKRKAHGIRTGNDKNNSNDTDMKRQYELKEIINKRR